MFHARVSSTILIDRLTAEANSPEFLESASRMKDSDLPLRQLGEIVTAPINNSIRDVSAAYRSNNVTVPLFRPVDIQGVWLETANAMRVSRDFEELHKKARVRPGNIVVAVAGTVGRAARVPSGVDYAAINGSCARIVVPTVSDGYLLAYLNTRYGYLSMMRWSVGSVQKHLNLEDISAITVPWPREQVQRYIGAKVRQAEQLASRSKLLLGFSRQVIECLLNRSLQQEGISTVSDSSSYDLLAMRLPHREGDGHHQVDQKHQRVIGAELSERIDGWYYKPEFIRAERALDALASTGFAMRSVKQIGRVGYGFMPTEDYWNRDEGAVLLRVTNIKDHLFIDTEDIKYVNAALSNNPRYRLQPGDVLCVQCGNSTGRVAYVSERFNNWVFPSFCLRVTDVKADWDSAYIAGFLASSLGQAQIQRTISITSVRPNTTKPALEAVKVVQFRPEVQRAIGNVIRQGIILREFIDPLCHAAKFIVEALIEKRITKQELESAQKALENGDPSLDRAILGRITEDGVDVEGRSPLFSDLDALYAAIDEAERAHTDGETS